MQRGKDHEQAASKIVPFSFTPGTLRHPPWEKPSSCSCPDGFLTSFTMWCSDWVYKILQSKAVVSKKCSGLTLRCFGRDLYKVGEKWSSGSD